MQRFLQQQWFLLVLAAVLAVGFLLSEPLAGLPEAFPKRLVVAGVLFVMAWTLDASAMVRAMRYPVPAGLAIAVNVVLMPLAAWGLTTVLPTRFDAGLVLLAVMPCTLASAAVWTRRAGGNDAVALVVTMATNFTCFLTIPFWLWLMTGSEVETPSMMLELLIIAVVPMLLGQLLRLCTAAAGWATRHKRALGVVAQLGILAMVIVGAIKAAGPIKSRDEPVGLLVWLGLLAMVTGLHLTALTTGRLLARFARLAEGDVTAVGFAGSQKTLMIGLQLGTQYSVIFGPLAILPMVAHHIVQLLIDTLVADRLRKREESAEQV